MQWLDKLERRFGRLAIPNLTFWIMIGQVLFYALGLFTTFPVDALTLQPVEVLLNGQVWRLVTFIFVPDVRVLSIWVIFGWILLFIYGNALEGFWGEFRFNLFIWIGVFSTGIASLIGVCIHHYVMDVPWELMAGFEVDNFYLLASLFLAFAVLNPNFELLLFFVLPVKVKYLAWLTWALFAFMVLFGAVVMKLVVLGAVVNMALFFGKDLFGSLKARKRRKTFEKQNARVAQDAFHTCTVCGLTDKDDPDMDFVYDGGKGYCRNHVPE